MYETNTIRLNNKYPTLNQWYLKKIKYNKNEHKYCNKYFVDQTKKDNRKTVYKTIK